MRTGDASDVAAQNQSRYLAWLTGFIAVVLWLTVLVGTCVNQMSSSTKVAPLE
jgi:hypothetical protein